MKGPKCGEQDPKVDIEEDLKAIKLFEDRNYVLCG